MGVCVGVCGGGGGLALTSIDPLAPIWINWYQTAICNYNRR